MALRRSNPSQFLMRQSDFITTNVMQWSLSAGDTFFGGFYIVLQEKWLWGAQKLCFADLPLCLCGPWENFSSELPTPNMYWKTSLWSYLHAEINGVSFGYFNAIIYSHTWADGTFLDFIPPQRRLEGKLDWKKLRQLCVLGGVFEIQMVLENFLHMIAP